MNQISINEMNELTACGFFKFNLNLFMSVSNTFYARKLVKIFLKNRQF